MSAIPEDVSPEACAAQLARKAEAVTALFDTLNAPAPEIFPSPPAHYRQRAEFRLWHEGEESCFLMFGRGGTREPVRVERFAPASLRINELMQSLRALLRGAPLLRQRLYQAEFLSTLAGEAMITLVYHRPLDAAWEQAARSAQELLGARLVGRSKGQRVVLDEAHVTERLLLDDTELAYRQPEGCFTQPNAEVNRAMLGWARRACAGVGGDLLELYCGIGNFTVALAPLFRRVLATEISTTAIAAAHHNLAANAVTNTFVARLSSAEASSAIARERPFKRLSGFDLGQFAPRTLLVDPPRAGLDDRTLAFAAGFERILYISCNPASLRANLESLGSAFRIERLALFDQFPYTEHMECGMMLCRTNTQGPDPTEVHTP